jgi:hypothetical protein
MRIKKLAHFENLKKIASLFDKDLRKNHSEFLANFRQKRASFYVIRRGIGPWPIESRTYALRIGAGRSNFDCRFSKEKEKLRP